jgi:hypothetical protein
MHWGDEHFADAGPPMILIHKGDCGGQVNERGICESCGELLTARDARIIDGPGMPKEFRADEDEEEADQAKRQRRTVVLSDP